MSSLHAAKRWVLPHGAYLGGSMPLPAAPCNQSLFNSSPLPMILPLPPLPLAGLSAEPHVSGVVRLTEEQGGILLIASDGLWDVAEADAVVQAICQADRWAAGQGRMWRNVAGWGAACGKIRAQAMWGGRCSLLIGQALCAAKRPCLTAHRPQPAAAGRRMAACWKSPTPSLPTP